MSNRSIESNSQQEPEQIWIKKKIMNTSTNKSVISKNNSFISHKNKIVHYSPFIIEGKSLN